MWGLCAGFGGGRRARCRAAFAAIGHTGHSRSQGAFKQVFKLFQLTLYIERGIPNELLHSLDGVPIMQPWLQILIVALWHRSNFARSHLSGGKALPAQSIPIYGQPFLELALLRWIWCFKLTNDTYHCPGDVPWAMIASWDRHLYSLVKCIQAGDF